MATAAVIDAAIVLVYRAITSAKIKLVPLSLLSKIAHIVLFPNLLRCHIHWVEYNHV